MVETTNNIVTDMSNDTDLDHFERMSEVLFERAKYFSRSGYFAEKKKQYYTSDYCKSIALNLMRSSNRYQRWSGGRFYIWERVLLYFKII